MSLHETWTVRECPSCGLVEDHYNGYCRMMVSADEGCGAQLSGPFQVMRVICTCPVGFGHVADPNCPRHQGASHTITGTEALHRD